MTAEPDTIHECKTDIAVRVMMRLFCTKSFGDVEPRDAACGSPDAESRDKTNRWKSSYFLR